MLIGIDVRRLCCQGNIQRTWAACGKLPIAAWPNSLADAVDELSQSVSL